MRLCCRLLLLLCQKCQRVYHLVAIATLLKVLQAAREEYRTIARAS